MTRWVHDPGLERSWGDGLSRTSEHIIAETRMRADPLEYWTRCECGATVSVEGFTRPESLTVLDFGDLVANVLAERWANHVNDMRKP